MVPMADRNEYQKHASRKQYREHTYTDGNTVRRQQTVPVPRRSEEVPQRSREEIIRAAIPAKARATGGHPSKRTYQAIRIELNHELEVLEDSLDGMIDLLKPGGRLCVITFHSIEDRIVKNCFKRNENPCTCPPNFPVCVCGKTSRGRMLTKKPILPSEEETERNRRSKSAKLRVFEKVTENG